MESERVMVGVWLVFPSKPGITDLNAAHMKQTMIDAANAGGLEPLDARWAIWLTAGNPHHCDRCARSDGGAGDPDA